MITTARHQLSLLRSRFLIKRYLESLLISVGAGILLFRPVQWLMGHTAATFVLCFTFVIIIFYLYQKTWKHIGASPASLARYLNHAYPQLQNSTDLLPADEGGLSVLQQLQRERVAVQFSQLYPTIALPHRLLTSVAILIASVILFVVLTNVAERSLTESIQSRESSPTEKDMPVKVHPSLEQTSVSITPPSYTGQPSTTTSNLNISSLENAVIKWTFSLSEDARWVALVFTGGDTVHTKRINEKWTLTRRAQRSTIYQLVWQSEGHIESSDYYKLEVFPDEAPMIKVSEPEQFTQFSITDPLKFNVKAALSDDYGLKESYMIATVSKGSGESVKFREERLEFSQKISGKKVSVERSIDLNKLGLEPGDELYFYIVAADVKSPQPNISRTETFFVQLQDTASHVLSIEGGLGVDLMPEYFRSQRQIIIDSEKLLREKKAISKQEFNARSNELGYDQKVLRLKYGEFLGEEFETSIGPGGHDEGAHNEEHHHEEGEDEEIEEQFGHVHDSENEHNLVPEAGHQHSTDLTDPDKKESVVDEFKHVHDDPEEATFFTQSIRAKLKAALTVMWDAELHLRMFDPEKSLPYQYQALKLLKEISNDSRIYVHKTGFDPPPVKEEKRLTGDLSEAKNSRASSAPLADDQYPAIREAVALLESKSASSVTAFSAGEQYLLRQAGTELTGVALEKPGQFLQALSLLKRLAEQEISSSETVAAMRTLQRQLLLALPEGTNSKRAPGVVEHPLQKAFVEQLERKQK